MEGWKSGLNLSSESEDTVVRIIFTTDTSRINYCCKDKAQDDYNSVPSGADEPDNLAEDVEGSWRKFVPESLTPLDLAIICRFKPVGPIKCLRFQHLYHKLCIILYIHPQR